MLPIRIPAVIQGRHEWGKNRIRSVVKRSGSLTKKVVDEIVQDLALLNRSFPGTGRHRNRRVLLKTLMRTRPVMKVCVFNQGRTQVTLAQQQDWVQALVPDSTNPVVFKN